MPAPSTWAVDGVALDAAGRWTVTDATKIHGPGEITYAKVTRPGRDGAVAVPLSRAVGSSSWTVGVLVEGTTYADMLTAKADLEALLMPARRLVTVQETAGTLVLEADALAARPPKWGDLTENGRAIPGEFEMEIPSGVWREPARTADLATTTGVKTVPALAGGSAPQAGFTFAFTPTASSCNLLLRDPADAGAWVRFSGAVTAGTQVTVDLATVTATQGGTGVSGLVDLGARPLTIRPDGRVELVTATNISALSLTSRRAWY